MHTTLRALAPLTFLLAPLAAGQTPDELVPRLEARLARAAENTAGLAATIAVGGESLVNAALGGREFDAPVAAPALQRALTALALMRKLGSEVGESGPFELDRPLSLYLADSLPEGATCTVRQLLAGTSGLAPYGALLTREDERGAEIATLVKRVRDAGLVAIPGHCFDPNESEELLLGLLTERLYGAPCSEVFTALASAAGLTGTGYLDAVPDATGDREDELDLERHPRPALAPFGEDRLYTTVNDLVQLVDSLAARGLLDEAPLRELLTPQPTFTSRGAATTTGFGLGVDLIQLGEYVGATVGGVCGDAAFHVVRYPSVELTIVIAANGADAPLAATARDLARIVLGLPPPGVQDLELDRDGSAPLVGTYQFGCDRLSLLRGEDGRLVLSWVNRPARRLLWQGGLDFVAADDPECRYAFRMAPDGLRAEALVMMEHGLRSEAVRIE